MSFEIPASVPGKTVQFVAFPQFLRCWSWSWWSVWFLWYSSDFSRRLFTCCSSGVSNTFLLLLSSRFWIPLWNNHQMFRPENARRDAYRADTVWGETWSTEETSSCKILFSSLSLRPIALMVWERKVYWGSFGLNILQVPSELVGWDSKNLRAGYLQQKSWPL